MEDINKFCDPLYSESDVFIPEDVKYQLIVSEEDKLKEALTQYEKLESLKPVLDSEAFQGNKDLFTLWSILWRFNWIDC